MKKNYPAKFIYFQNKRRELFQRQLMRCSNNFSWILILFRKISSSLSQNIPHSSSYPHDIFLNWLFSGFFCGSLPCIWRFSIFWEWHLYNKLEDKEKNTEEQQCSRQRKGALLHSFCDSSLAGWPPIPDPPTKLSAPQEWPKRSPAPHHPRQGQSSWPEGIQTPVNTPKWRFGPHNTSR